MRLLVIRTSAMGDVALTAPVLAGMRRQYSDIEIVLLTRPAFKPFFNSINGIRFFIADLKDRHKGLPGIFRLFNDLKKSEFDAVIDLHDVLRSKILRFLFSLSGVPVSVIDKGRKEKRALITGKRKVQLKHVVERYCDVFAKAGFPVSPLNEVVIVPVGDALKKAGELTGNGIGLNIGVAPYAKHKLKMWPEENMIRLLELLSAHKNSRFWLFGGSEDFDSLIAFQKRVAGSVSLAGTLNLEEELALMSKLDLMIAMDSSNMHMAALAGTKVISIWGGTDPLGGFSAWMQPGKYSIRIPVDELSCRPCTIYGKGESSRNFACMRLLTPEIVFEKIVALGLLR